MHDEITCLRCNTEQVLPPGRIRPWREPGTDSWLLTASTSFDGGSAAASRIQLERRLRSGNVSTEERTALIAEPFIELDQFQRIKSVRGVPRSIASVLILLLLIVSAVTGGMWLRYLQPGFTPNQFFVLMLGLSSMATFILALLVARGALTHNQRVAARYVTPRLAWSLAGMRPSLAELENVLAGLRESCTPTCF